jgi:hypothetical protein
MRTFVPFGIYLVIRFVTAVEHLAAEISTQSIRAATVLLIYRPHALVASTWWIIDNIK